MAELHQETVTCVHHWTDRLFTFRTTRDPALRFRNGEFAMVGIEVDGKPLLRAYSMAVHAGERKLRGEVARSLIALTDGPSWPGWRVRLGRQDGYRRADGGRPFSDR